MAARSTPETCEHLRQEVLRQLGSPAQLISLEQRGAHHVGGFAVCAGRILSFVLDAESNRLRTQPLLQLLRRSRA